MSTLASTAFDNSGSAQVGFWFFQNPISLTNTPRGGGFEFSGVHAEGDILVQSNFTNGGVVDSVTVFEWDPDAPGNLALVKQRDRSAIRLWARP